MVNLVKGDVFASNADIIAHGVNCKGAFGAGVAAIVARKYPKARHYYQDKFEEDGWRIGDVQFVKVLGKQEYIANCTTQHNFGSNDSIPGFHVDYDAIRSCMEKVKEFAKNNNFSVGMPKIGSGLAGGNWDMIKSILDEVFHDHDATVYVLE